MHKGYSSWKLSLSGDNVIIIMVSLEYLRKSPALYVVSDWSIAFFDQPILGKL